MRTLLLGLLLSPLAYGQAVRVDVPLLTSGPNVPVSGGPLPQTLWMANATVAICTHPSNTYSACLASPIATYSDANKSHTCPSNAQLTQLFGAVCTSNAGTRGNVGFWYDGGTVDYWAVGSQGQFGPFTTSGGTTGPAGPAGPAGPQGPPGSGSISGQSTTRLPLPTSANVIGAQSNFTDTGSATSSLVPFSANGIPTSGTISGQSIVNTYPLCGASTTSCTTQGHLNETTAGQITGTENFTVTGGGIAAQTRPTASLTAWGGKADGVTDNLSFLNLAVASCNAANGNSCNTTLECSGANGCLIQNGSGLSAAPGGKTIALRLQGTLKPKSTFVLPANYSISCGPGGGVGASSFQAIPSCAILHPTVNGTLGTNVNATGSQTVTPAFTNGTLAANTQVGTWWSVASQQTCTGMAATRIVTAANVVNTTFSGGACVDDLGNSETLRIPPQKTITITGCSDASFNATGQPVINRNWGSKNIPAITSGITAPAAPAFSVQVYENAGASTATGCQIVGFDGWKYDEVRITAFDTGAGTVTGTFAHTHASTALWGMVGTYITGGNHSIDGGVQFSGAQGMNLLIDNAPTVNIDGMGVTAALSETSGAMECDGCFWGQMSKLRLLGTGNNGCRSSCGPAAYPWALRCSQDAARSNGIGCGNASINDTTLSGGIEVDGNGMASPGGSGVTIGPVHNLIIEQAVDSAITFDNSFSLGGEAAVIADSILLSDPGLSQMQYVVGATDCCIRNGLGSANIGTYSSQNRPFTLINNPYWEAGPEFHNASALTSATILDNPEAYALDTNINPLLIQNGFVKGDIVGANAGMAPIEFRYASLGGITANPACGTCSNVVGYDGVANSGFEIQTDGGGSSAGVTVGSTTLTVYPGDVLIVDIKVRPGANNYGNLPQGNGFGGRQYWSFTGAASTPFPQSVGTTLIPLLHDSWQEARAVAIAQSATTGAQNITWQVYSGHAGSPNIGNQYFNPGWFFIPMSNNPAWDGVTTLADVMEFARTGLKGYIPPSSLTGVSYTHYPFNAPSSATGVWEATANGVDNTGVVDAGTLLNAKTTAICPLSNPPKIHLAAGNYTINSGWLIAATSTTCGALDIGGDGESTIISTNCSGNTYGIWFDNTTNSGDNFKGSRIHDLVIQDTSGTGACQDLLKVTQVADMKIERVTALSAQGNTYSTGTISSAGAVVTGVGTTFTSAMNHGELQITIAGVPYHAEICVFTNGTHVSLCSTAFPSGNIGGGTAFAIAYGGRALTCDPGFSYSQYGSIRDFRAFGNMFGIFALGSASGGCSRWVVDGKGGHIRSTPGSRVTNSEGIHLGKGSDTWDINIPINDQSIGYTLDSTHGNVIRGEFEVNATLAPVTTCNGGVGLQACVTGAEISAESNAHGWNNHFLDPYFYLVGTVYQFDNATGAFNSYIEGDRTLSGQYTQHYYFYGTTTCPGSASGIPVILSTYDCNHQLIAQTVN